MRARKDKTAQDRPLKLLLWTALAGMIFGLVGLGEPIEDILRTTRNSLHWHKASGDIVLVKIDDASLRQAGRWPWPRGYHARLTDSLTRAGAKRIFFDIAFFGRTDPQNDRLLEEAFRRSKRVIIASRTRSGPLSGLEKEVTPLPLFRGHAKMATISWRYNYQNAVWRLPFGTQWQGQFIPSFSAMLSGTRTPEKDETFIADYSLDPKTIPAFSAANILQGAFDPRSIRGKDVVIGATSETAQDLFFVPGIGKLGGVYVHIIGAETLKSGRPVDLGWWPSLLLGLLAAAFALQRKTGAQQATVLAIVSGALLVGTAGLEARLIYLDIMPGLFVLTIVGSTLLARRFRQRGLVNSISGLPNLSALRSNRQGRDQALIVARVLNYAEAVAALPANAERQLIEQIVSRLSLGAKDRVLYQGDGGIFAWFEEQRKPFDNHIDALHALFRSAAKVGGISVDLSISFGVEIGSSRSLANRLGSAIVAAEQAAHDGLKWKYHEPDSLEAASWKLSMLSQLDSAIDKGEVWIAYQPKLELETGRIIGAEALARWTHPEKGPIAASEFVAAAEQHDRIGKLTDFVLHSAVSAAAAINKGGLDFNVSVNLSARLLTDKQFVIRVAALLARLGLEARHLTLELTETSELANSGESLEMLGRLRDLGIKISIDDYGTGLSTLDYLKKIPANEIKIDQSFVKAMCENRSDRLMVQSTIGLAHSLGRTVVAEGVEQRDTLDALREMGCDIAQGFIIGRPMSMESLAKRIATDRRRRVA